MALLGSAALGLVLGWLSFLVSRGSRAQFSVSALGFAAVALIGAAALAFFYVGLAGALAASIGVGAGMLGASAVLGIKTATHH